MMYDINNMAQFYVHFDLPCSVAYDPTDPEPKYVYRLVTSPNIFTMSPQMYNQIKALLSSDVWVDGATITTKTEDGMEIISFDDR